MSYHQITSGERYRLSALRVQGLGNAQIARVLGRHRSTIWREVRRNAHPTDGYYKVEKAIQRARGRRRRAHSHPRFSPQQLSQVWRLIQCKLSPEQASGHLSRVGELRISHETIYRHIWRDKHRGGGLHRHLRCAVKRRRKRYRSYDSRGRLAGKRMINERPATVEDRRELGHWEIDTVLGKGSRHCILTMVERRSGYALIGKLTSRTKEQATAKAIELIQRYRLHFRTVTADNGTEFHGYADIEAATNVPFYFANPHHSWERGTNENTNGLIRQYLPKNNSMQSLTQEGCDQIAKALNTRPRKRHEYRNPEEILFER